jgi:hypothetical protein
MKHGTLPLRPFGPAGIALVWIKFMPGPEGADWKAGGF